MSKFLILAEKSQIAKNAVSALSGSEAKAVDSGFKSKGADGKEYPVYYYTAGDYTAVATQGHMLRMLKPDETVVNGKIVVDETKKLWNWEQMNSMDFSSVRKVVSEGKEGIGKAVEKAIKSASSLIHAGDMDAEGQNLADEVIEFYGYKGDVKRLNTADVSVSALKEAGKKMKSNSEYEYLNRIAETRQMKDFIKGMLGTEAFTLAKGARTGKFGKDSTVIYGTLKACYIQEAVKRENEINDFKPKDFTVVSFDANADGKKCRVSCEFPKDDSILDENGYLTDESKIKDFIASVNSKSFSGKAEEKSVNVAPPAPFDLQGLQKTCFKLFNLKPEQVVDIADSLRLDFDEPLITYGRTAHKELPESFYNERSKVLPNIAKFLGISDFKEKQGFKSKCFVADSKLEEHHGIAPTGADASKYSLSDIQKKVLGVIYERYLMQFLGERTDLRKSLVVDLGNGRKAKCSSSQVQNAGWNIFNKEEKCETEEKIPFTDKNASFVLDNPLEKKGKTKAPSRFNLVSLMEAVSKKGNGTPATLANTLQDTVGKGYFTVDKKGEITPTQKGMEYFSDVPECYRDTDRLGKEKTEIEDLITSGKISKEKYLDELNKNWSNEIKSFANSFRTEKTSEKKRDEVVYDNGLIEGKYVWELEKNGERRTLWRKDGLFSAISADDAYEILAGNDVRIDNLISKNGKTFSAVVKNTGWSEKDKYGCVKPLTEFEFEKEKNFS